MKINMYMNCSGYSFIDVLLQLPGYWVCKLLKYKLVYWYSVTVSPITVIEVLPRLTVSRDNKRNGQVINAHAHAKG